MYESIDVTVVILQQSGTCCALIHVDYSGYNMCYYTLTLHITQIRWQNNLLPL